MTRLAQLAIPLLGGGCAALPEAPAAAPAQSIGVSKLAQSTRSWDGKPLPAYPRGQPEITILRIAIAPGARLPTHLHPTINAGVLIGGELKVVTQAGGTLHLKAGDPIVEVVNTWHYGINEGQVPADILVFYAGTPGRPISVPAPH
jgi:quercetin dioxygenase-like cupin family protein